MFMNAAVYEGTEVRALAPEGDPGVHMYRLVRHQVGGGWQGGRGAPAWSCWLAAWVEPELLPLQCVAAAVWAVAAAAGQRARAQASS
jgi:hypothetical protein